MVKIAITGSTGLIGSRIIELLNEDFEFIELIWPRFDVTKKDEMWKILKGVKYDLLFHLAAYTSVDGAEKEKKLASDINVTGTKNIFEAVSEMKKKLIYVSTDFIFDGKKSPYYEDSVPHPVSYYGQTKYQGEQLIKNQAMIVRFSYPYRTAYELKPDFVKRLKQTLEEKKPLTLVTDSFITPTFIDDIAHAMNHLFQNFSPEIFHIVGEDSLSPFDSGKMIAKIFALDQSLILPTTYDEYSKGKAKRPQYSDIRSKKNTFHKMKTFEEGLFEIKKQLSQE